MPERLRIKDDVPLTLTIERGGILKWHADALGLSIDELTESIIGSWIIAHQDFTLALRRGRR